MDYISSTSYSFGDVVFAWVSGSIQSKSGGEYCNESQTFIHFIRSFDAMEGTSSQGPTFTS